MSGKNYLDDMFGAFGGDQSDHEDGVQVDKKLKNKPHSKKSSSPDSKKLKSKRKADKKADDLEGEVNANQKKKRQAVDG